MGFVSIDKIKDEDIKKVEQLNNRPNLSGGYGQAKLSAEQLKKWFDSYPSVVREKVDDIIEALSNENLKGNYIAMGLPDEIGNCLADLVNAIFSGVLANHLRVILAENSDSQTLVEALNGIKSDLADTIGSDKIADGAVKTDYNEDGSVSNSKLAHDAVYTDAIKDGAVTAAKIADKSVYTNKIAENAVNRMQLIESVRKNIDLAFAYVSYNPSLGQLMLMRSGAQAWLGDVPKQVFINLIPDGSITEKRIADGAVTEDKLSQNVQTKLGKAYVNVSYDSETGVLTFTGNNSNVTKEIDLPLERLVARGEFDSDSKNIVLYFDDSNIDPLKIPVGSLITSVNEDIEKLKGRVIEKVEIGPKFDLNSMQIKYFLMFTFVGGDSYDVLLENTISTEMLQDASVTTYKIYPKSIITMNIADEAVTEDKLNTAVQEKLRRVVKSMFVDENLWFDGSGNMELRTDLVIECDNYEMRVDTKDIIGSIETEQIQSKAITIDKMSDDLKNDINNIKNLEKRIETLEGSTLVTVIDNSEAYEKTVPADVGKYAVINKVGGKTTSIESRRRVNLFDESAITYASKINGTRDSELGVVENGYLKAKYGKRGNTVLWAPFKMYLTAGTYIISADMYLGSFVTSKIMYLGLAKGDASSPKSAATTVSSYDAWERRSVTVTLTEDGYYYLEAEAAGTAGNYTNLDARFKNILVTRENIIEEPIATFEIPKAIRNREGYGLSGSYIDFDRKVFVNADGEEEDIAAELTSDEDFLFIEVLPLGTLRFVNEDGTETPVPSTITYQKKL